MNPIFKGTAVAITTPFNQGIVDYKAFKSHVDFLIDHDIQAIFVNGTTGEGSTLTEEEKLNLVKLAVKTANGRVPIIVGTGTNDTKTSVDHSLKVKEAGADGIMLITPYYNKTNQRGLLEHFTTIANATKLPVVLYNVPARTGMTIEVETAKILAENPYIYALKDATGDLAYFQNLKESLPQDFFIYSGNDDLILPFYEKGGDGVVSVIANAVPSEFETIYREYQKNPLIAQKLFDQIKPLVVQIGCDINPIPVKALVSHLGFGKNELRLPLVSLDEEQEQLVIEAYQEFKGGWR